MGESSWPFVGRDTELIAAVASLAQRGALVLAGEAGVGKSRFVRELVDREVGDPVVVTASVSSTEIPLGAFAPLLSSPGAESTDLPGLERALAEMRRRRGTLVVVDDAHLLDEVSATLVGQLAAERTVRLLLVIRSGEAAPAAVTGIWKGGEVERMDLGPLSEAQCSRLFRAVLRGPMDARDEHRLHAATRGNVLWMRHLVEGERAAGRLVWAEGAWQWRGPAGLSPALRDLVAARIGTLTPAQQRVLELVSLAEPLGLGLVTALAEAAAVEEAADRGLIVVEPEGERWNVRLGHPLYSEAIRDGLSVPRARRLRGELSAALAGTGARRAGDGLRRAVLDLGSDRRPDPDTLVEAALQANTLGDYALAERLLRAACDAGGGFRARVALGYLMGHFLRNDEAAAQLALAVEEARTDEERVQVTVTRTLWLFLISRRPDEAAKAVEATAARVRPEARLPLEGARAAMATARGDFAAAREHARTALADPDLSPHGTIYAAWAEAHAAGQMGDMPVRPVVERGMAVGARSPDTAPFMPNIGFAEIVAADLAGQPEIGRHRVAWAESLPGAGAGALVALYRGRTSLAAGQPHLAARLLESTLPTFPGHAGGWGTWIHAMLARAHAMAGDRESARRTLEVADSLRDPCTTALEWEVELARAWVAAAEGARRDAVRHLLSATGAVQRRKALAVEVLLRQTAIRFGGRGQVERLAWLAGELGSTRARLAAAHAEALVASDAARLEAVSGELEDAGMVLEAVDAAAQASAVARETGRLGTATTAERRARELAARCDARTPALEDVGVAVALSSREREVVTLAADGLTNREIATRLHLSVRTVESHVYRACTRLGVPDRATLVAVTVPSSSR